MKNYKLDEFLKKLATASGDEVLDLVGEFQSGSIAVEMRFVEDFTEDEDS
jgi:hypothetical protein